MTLIDGNPEITDTRGRFVHVYATPSAGAVHIGVFEDAETPMGR